MQPKRNKGYNEGCEECTPISFPSSPLHHRYQCRFGQGGASHRLSAPLRSERREQGQNAFAHAILRVGDVPELALTQGICVIWISLRGPSRSPSRIAGCRLSCSFHQTEQGQNGHRARPLTKSLCPRWGSKVIISRAACTFWTFCVTLSARSFCPKWRCKLSVSHAACLVCVFCMSLPAANLHTHGCPNCPVHVRGARFGPFV